MQELKERVDARTERVKLALLTANPQHISLLFPDIVPESPQTEADIDSALADNGPVEFQAVSEEEAQDMLAVLSRAGVLNADDLSLDLTGEL